MVGSSKPAPNSPQAKQRMRPESHSGQNHAAVSAGGLGRPMQLGWNARRQGPPHVTRPAMHRLPLDSIAWKLLERCIGVWKIKACRMQTA